MTNKVEEAFNILKEAMQTDPGYAKSWHCKIAEMCELAITEDSNGLVPYEIAYEMSNDGAAKFMKLHFGVITWE